VVDLKTPASGESSRNDYSNIDHLGAQDQVKFVICDRDDYQWARFKLDEYELPGRVSDVLFSPSHGELGGRELADWIIQDNLPVRMQLQLHKYLWDDQPGH
jgi:7-carboxy-7-deazaguanine synthase